MQVVPFHFMINELDLKLRVIVVLENHFFPRPLPGIVNKNKFKNVTVGILFIIFFFNSRKDLK